MITSTTPCTCNGWIGSPGRTPRNSAYRSSAVFVICCGMAVRHTRVDYLEAARLDDVLVLATWIIASDHRLRCTRRFEILRVADGKRVLEAEIDFFSLNLDTGKPCRFPPEFTLFYKPLQEVVAAYADLSKTAHHIGRWPR